MSQYSLLVADRDLDSRSRYEDLARRGDYDVRMVSSGYEALEVVQKGGIHLSIVDDGVPELGGIETIRLLVRRLPILPCVLVVQNPTNERRLEAIGVGAVTMITKPLDLETLQVTIERILKNHYSDAESSGSGNLIHRSLR